MTTGKVLRSIAGASSPVAFSPDGRLALSGSNDNTLRLWDLALGKQLRSFTGNWNSVSSVAFSPDGRFALSGTCDEKDPGDHPCVRGSMKLWDLAAGKELRSFSEHAGSSDP